MNEFFMESDEILVRVSANLSRLEKGSCSAEELDELYRDIHTLKGSAQLFGLRTIGTVSHTMESCLDPIRKFKVSPSPALLDALFKSVDLIERLLEDVKSNGDGKALEQAVSSVVPRLIQSACSQFGEEIVPITDGLLPAGSDSAAMPTVQANIAAPDPETPPPEKIIEHPKNEPQSEGAAQVSTDPASGDTSIRVQVGLLDKLMNLIGEMVLVRNQVLQYSNRSEDLGFINLSQRLDLVTSDLQDQVMKTRMQPIGNVVGKFQRVTRDLAKELHKQIDLTIQGKDTELDKTLLEAIKDPLTHIVRNSCDHGIELPEERRVAGKPATGHVLISAFHEGGQVVIEISDDGRGLNRKKILKKAVEKNLLSNEKAESLSDRDILNLIFLPGFSTAEKVSAVSGRGVGMDVVRTNIERIGGSVDIESVEGKGSTIRLRIPLTLAIVPAMLARSHGATYAIPQVKLVELVRVDLNDQQSASKIQMLQGKPVYELRGKTLPLVDLGSVLGRGERDDIHSRSCINIVVLSTEGGSFGLIVEEILDTADIVVKPLSKFLKSLDVYSAATILGSGDVALIVDPEGIAKSTNLSSGARKQEGVFVEQGQADRLKNADAQEYLLFRTNGLGKYAMPLCLVSRLEEFARSQIEYTGHRPIVRYRNAILPLIDLNKVLGLEGNSQNESAPISTIVVQKSDRYFGIMVNAILDVMNVEIAIDDSLKKQDGVLGSVIASSEVLTVIDALGIIEKEMGLDSEAQSEQAKPNGMQKPKVLYAEDVAFFRRQVSQLLSSKGFDVTAVVDGKAALEILKSADAPAYALILSDIEMPNMNGYELARQTRGLERYKSVPLMALTTRFNQRDIEEGLKAGFDCYLEKLNPDVLMEKIKQTIEFKEKRLSR